MIILEKIFKKFYDERNWKIWKEFISLIWVIFTIGLGNALYTSIVFGYYFELGLSFFINFQFNTLVIGIIPITVLIITKQKFLLSKHLNSAKDLNKNLEKEKVYSNDEQFVRFFADNEKDFIEFYLNDFLFIESSGNYVELYLSESDNIIKKTFRSTIKKSLDFFADTREIIQCHRAFIVNINKIINAKGNSQGLRLSIKNCETEVPVSRGFVNDVKNKIS
jgi:DNA-binding LytR/AlgR family response regulator